MKISDTKSGDPALKQSILIANRSTEIQELLAFVLQSNLDVEVQQLSSGFKIINYLSSGRRADLIICDLNMTDGNAVDVYEYLKSHNTTIPLVTISSQSQSQELHKALDASWIYHLKTPFTEKQILNFISAKLNDLKELDLSVSYLPVSLNLLKKVRNISIPLFIKINEHKYVKLTQQSSKFTETTYKKYQQKSLTHLYIESFSAHDFIADYQKKTLSDFAWEEADLNKETELVKLNTELVRDMATQLGWQDDLVELALRNVKRALHVAQSNPDLNLVLNQFHKIEMYGYADHCVLLVLLSTGLAYHMGLGDELTVRKLTFASLFHDMTLSDTLYKNKKRFLQLLARREATPNKDLKEMLSHPTKAAELCRQWDYCPAVVDTIIFQHHEEPDGKGFPMGKNHDEIHPLSCILIICEDFINYFIDHIGNHNFQKYISDNQQKYSLGQFKPVFDSLTKILSQTALQTAS